MTRSVEETQADSAAADQAHQALVEAHRLAKLKHAEETARAKAGVGSAKALAEAADNVAFTEHPIAAAFQRVQELKAEHRAAEAEQTAGEWVTTEAVLRAEDELSDKAIEAAYERKVATWRAHAAFCQQVNQIANVRFDTYGAANDATSPIRRGAGGLIKAKGQDMRSRAVLEPLERLHRQFMQRFTAGQPKAQR